MCTICSKGFHPTMYGWVVLHVTMWMINTRVAEAAFFCPLLLPSLVTFYLAASSVAEASSFSISSSSAPLFTPFTCNTNVSVSESFRSFQNLLACWNLIKKGILKLIPGVKSRFPSPRLPLEVSQWASPKFHWRIPISSDLKLNVAGSWNILIIETLL